MSSGEAEAFGRTIDLGPLLTTLHGTPLTTRQMENELDTIGVKSEDGAKLEHEVISRALKRIGKGERILGLVTGNAFLQDIVAIEASVKKAIDKDALPCHDCASDLSDAEWALLAPYLSLRPETSGGRKYPTREIFKALRYIARTGVGWSKLPDDLPPWYVVLDNSRRWIRNNRLGTVITALQAMHMPALAAKNDRDQAKPIVPPNADAVHGCSQRRLSHGTLAVLRQEVSKIDRLLSQLVVDQIR